MKNSFTVQNLKCGGCANTIQKNIEKLEGITNVHVESSEVFFEHDDEAQSQAVVQTLKTLGYPIETEKNNLALKAKSFVSCGMGRLANN